jgi:hypothetical protein
VKVTATDSGSETVSDTFSLTITNTNDAPTVANPIADQTIAEDSSLNFQIASNVFADMDQGDSLSYSATLSNGAALPSWLSFNAATQNFTGTPSNGDVGAVDVKVTATDGGSETVSDTFSLTITNTNDAPEVTSTPGTTINEDELFSYFIFYRDVDLGDSVTLNIETKPDWLSFDVASRRLFGTPENKDIGSHDVAIKIEDKQGITAEQDFTVTVLNTNDAPTITQILYDQTVKENNLFSYTFAENLFLDEDPDDTLNYSLTLSNGSDVPEWLSLNTADRTLSGTPGNNDVGEVSLKLIATDGGGLKSEGQFSVTISNTNNAPMVSKSNLTKNISWNGQSQNIDAASEVFLIQTKSMAIV